MKTKKATCLIVASSFFAHFSMSAINSRPKDNIKSITKKVISYIKEKANAVKTKTKKGFNSVKNSIQKNISKIDFRNINFKKNAPYLITAISALAITAVSLQWLFKKNTNADKQTPVKGIHSMLTIEKVLPEHIPSTLPSKNGAILETAAAIGAVSLIAALLLGLRHLITQNNGDDSRINPSGSNRKRKTTSARQIRHGKKMQHNKKTTRRTTTKTSKEILIEETIRDMIYLDDTGLEGKETKKSNKKKKTNLKKRDAKRTLKKGLSVKNLRQYFESKSSQGNKKRRNSTTIDSTNVAALVRRFDDFVERNRKGATTRTIITVTQKNF